MSRSLHTLSAVALVLITTAAVGAEAPAAPRFGYAPDRGLEFQHGETDLWVGLRFQTRIDSYPGDLDSVDDLLEDEDPELDLRRARIKGGGKLIREWLTIYSEYDFPSDTWLDYRATFTVNDWMALRLGQWKSEFSRERVDSSGKQQLVERSIANYWFTMDRQRGIATTARFGRGSQTDISLWVEALSGKGRGGSFGGGDMLVLGRLQWNPAGEVLAFSQSDLVRRDKPLPSIAIAHVRGDTPHTRFSSDGGGDLPGFEEGDYELEQWLIETALHYRGFGWQQELHFKEIVDKGSGEKRRLSGGYLQLGSFLSEWWPVVPQPLELVGRYAWVDPDRDGEEDQREWTLGANWFFNGHRNKLTVDYSWLNFEDEIKGASKQRLRLQWELSL